MTETVQAFVERLFMLYGSKLLAFFNRRVGQSEAADHAQEVYTRMLRTRDWESIRNPEAYLFTVAGNLLRERAHLACIERYAVDVQDPAVQEQLARFPAFGEDVDAERRIQKLQHVLRELSPKCQATVVLQLWYGQSYAQIAEQLDISPNMVKKYLGQAIQHCRRRMAHLG